MTRTHYHIKRPDGTVTALTLPTVAWALARAAVLASFEDDVRFHVIKCEKEHIYSDVCL